MRVHPIQLFVYGTLKQGFVNHARFCARVRAIEPATVWGRLYGLDAGYPALEVPPWHILAQGTADPIQDARTQATWDQVTFARPAGDWDLIEGELLTFANPAADLPPIDRLEGFRVGGGCLYRRVLLAARCQGCIIPSWAYEGSALGGLRLPGPAWSPP